MKFESGDKVCFKYDSGWGIKTRFFGEVDRYEKQDGKSGYWINVADGAEIETPFDLLVGNGKKYKQVWVETRDIRELKRDRDFTVTPADKLQTEDA